MAHKDSWCQGRADSWDSPQYADMKVWFLKEVHTDAVDLVIIEGYDILADENIVKHFHLCLELEGSKAISRARRLKKWSHNASGV